MCGICGLIYFDRQRAVDERTLVSMRDVMTHRGPDDDGLYIKGNVGLGFRRLSIVDLSGGHQPMTNEDGTVWIIFNGEIYNHAHLRRDLEAKGHVYRTRSDTETIIHLYEEYGIDAFNKMNGMFGIALWDEKKQRLVLVRDRLGIKPLYYCHLGDSFIFGSEIKSLLKSGHIRPELNTSVLHEFLTFRYVAGEDTLFRHIYNLLPGHILVWENGRLTIKKFWDFPPPGANESITEKQAVQQLGNLLFDSVRLRLMSDVPLGTFNSGGLDSSLVSAYAVKASNLQLNTFSVGFQEPEFDESRYAMIVAKRYHTRHHQIVVDNRTFANALPQMIWFNDEPLNHANSVQIYYISKLAKDYVTVVLTGEGSDELFGGYPRYLMARAAGVLGHTPAFARRLIKFALSAWPERRVRKLSEATVLSPSELIVLNSATTSPQTVARVIAVDSDNNFIEKRLALIGAANPIKGDLLDRLIRLDLKTYLVSILNRQDKMSMAASVESRVPFLDYRLVEWGLRLPLRMKFSRYQTKAIVKKVGETMLPKEIVYRRKSGFGVPLRKWFADEGGLGRYLEIFSEPRFRQRGYLHIKAVDKLVEQQRHGQADHSELLWTLINLELWQRTFVDSSI